MYEDVTLGHEEGKVLLHLQLTHGLVGLVAQDVGHHGLFDMVLATGHQCHADAVAVEGEHRITLRHEDGLAAVIGQERVLAVGLADEDTLLHLSLQVQPVLVVAHLAQIVVPAHLVEHVNSQHLGRMRVEFQLTEQLFQRISLIRICREQTL